MLVPDNPQETWCYTIQMFENCPKIASLHFPKPLESNAAFLALEDAPKFGATNAAVCYDL